MPLTSELEKRIRTHEPGNPGPGCPWGVHVSVSVSIYIYNYRLVVFVEASFAAAEEGQVERFATHIPACHSDAWCWPPLRCCSRSKRDGFGLARLFVVPLAVPTYGWVFPCLEWLGLTVLLWLEVMAFSFAMGRLCTF